MEANKTRGNSKSNKIILGVIILVIVAVVVYAFVSKNKDDKVEVKNQVELTFDNLNENWVRLDGDTRYEIGFEYGDEFIYAIYRHGDYLPSTVSTNATFTINGNVISFSYSVDDVTYSEQYNAAVSADELMLSPVKGSGATLKGKYINSNSDLYAQYDQQNSQQNGNNTTTSPSSTTHQTSTPATTSTTKTTTQVAQSFSLPADLTQYFYNSLEGIYGYEPKPYSENEWGKLYKLGKYEVYYSKHNDSGAEYVSVRVKDLPVGKDAYSIEELFALFHGEWEKDENSIWVWMDDGYVLFYETGDNQYGDIIVYSPFMQTD